MAATNQQAADILADAISKLRDAYKAANSADDKDKIFAVMEVLQGELDQITAQGLNNNTQGYTALTDAFKGYADQLHQAQNDINNIVKYTKLASDVVQALQKVAALLA